MGRKKLYDEESVPCTVRVPLSFIRMKPLAAMANSEWIRSHLPLDNGEQVALKELIASTGNGVKPEQIDAVKYFLDMFYKLFEFTTIKQVTKLISEHEEEILANASVLEAMVDGGDG